MTEIRSSAAPLKPAEQRILLKTATSKDAVITATLLERAGIACCTCKTVQAVAQEMRAGVGALLIAEEMLTDGAMADVVELLETQPKWSDLPVLIIASSGVVSNAVIEAMDMPANITVIERPLRIYALISAVRSALRARNRQYELRAVLEGLHEADQRKTEFLATLAHELRNPLAPLRTALSILTMKPHSAETARPHYEMMGRQVNHMVRLIDDLMEVSRITRGKIELKTEPISLARVLDDAIELSRPAIDSGNHRLRIELPDEGFLVRGDAVRLTQVFSNLLNNAAKYTPAGGNIDVLSSTRGGRAVVRIRDSGVGVPNDMLDAIFEMFVQVSDTQRAGQGGLGIGLTLVKRLVELHGGTVRASSAGPGLGTEVTVELPMAQEAQLAPSARSGALRSAIGERVMIVDDNRDAADSLSVLLKVFGARTCVAYDGHSALECLQTFQPTVAVIDIGMPVMDGCELASRLRGDPRTAHILLVALTGWGQPDDRARIAAAGFDHHFLKPLDSEALIGALDSRRSAAGAPARNVPQDRRSRSTAS